MKKILAIAAACAALAACTKETSTAEGSFVKGQVVTIDINADLSETKVASELNSDGKTVDFKWQTGDKVKVTVGTESAEFTLVSGAGTDYAKFKGTMPASGSTFTVQYPYDTPDIASQTYDPTSSEVIPHDEMLMMPDGTCSLDDKSFTLKPRNAALRLNLYGASQTVSKIVVTNKSASATYTLNISPAVTLSTDSSNPTPFFIVVPAGSYVFSAEVINTASGPSSPGTRPTDAIQNGEFTVGGTTNVFTATASRTFNAGEILNMPAKSVAVTLLTKVYFSKSNLYYDRTESLASFKFEENQYDYTTSYDANHVCRFRWASNSGDLEADTNSALGTSSSLSGSADDVFFTNATESTPRSDFAVNGVSNTWRALSQSEWAYLLNSRQDANRFAKALVNNVKGMIIFPDGYNGGVAISAVTGVAAVNTTGADYPTANVDDWPSMESAGCVFLPAAGYRDGTSAFPSLYGTPGYYWSASPRYGSGAYRLVFDKSTVTYSDDYGRYYGYSVRLVCAAE